MSDQLKSRVIAFEIYPDSIPPPFDGSKDLSSAIADEMAKRGYAGAVSPMHEPLKNPIRDDSDGIKPHYHVMCVFSVARSIEMVSQLSHSVFNGTNAIAISELGSYDRYLTHKDSQDKQQFDGVLPTDFGSFHSDEYYLDCSKSVWMLDFIKNNNCSTFKGCVNELRSQGHFWAIDFVVKNSYFIKTYLGA